MAEQIKADAGMFEHHLLDGGMAADQRSHARKQFFQTEWLGEVIVGTDIQPFHAVLYAITCAQDQHRLLEPALAPSTEQIKTIAVRQPQIEDHDIVSRLNDGIGRGCAGPGQRDGV